MTLVVVVVLDFATKGREQVQREESSGKVVTINGFHESKSTQARNGGFKIVDVLFCGEAYPLSLSVSVHGLLKSVNVPALSL